MIRTELSGLGSEAVGLELALGGFSALGELFWPRTSHKREESDSCHFWVGRFSYVLLLFALRVVRSEVSDHESEL